MQTLRSLRAEKKLTLNQVARLVGTHSSNLSRIERGESLPSLETAKALSRLYKTTLGVIYEMTAKAIESKNKQ